MAKKNARDTERRAIAEKLRKDQERQEKRRSLLILGGCIVVVVGLLAAALVPYIKNVREERRAAGVSLSSLGVSASAASCDEVTEEPATGNNDHLPEGQAIPYDQAPPSSGPHWGNFLVGSEIRTFYTSQDRPPVERLVHSLEHGYTVLWYDDTIKPGTDAYQDVQAFADKLDVTDKFIAAPWGESDGGTFPEGKHVALTHWTGPEDQQGVTQYCGAPSGKVLADFMEEFPQGNTPEPGAA